MPGHCTMHIANKWPNGTKGQRLLSRKRCGWKWISGRIYRYIICLVVNEVWRLWMKAHMQGVACSPAASLVPGTASEFTSLWWANDPRDWDAQLSSIRLQAIEGIIGHWPLHISRQKAYGFLFFPKESSSCPLHIQDPKKWQQKLLFSSVARSRRHKGLRPGP